MVGIFPHSDWISPYLVRVWENADQKNSEYGHIPRSEHDIVTDQKHNILIELKDIKIRNVQIDANTAELSSEIYCNKFCQSVNPKWQSIYVLKPSNILGEIDKHFFI